MASSTSSQIKKTSSNLMQTIKSANQLNEFLFNFGFSWNCELKINKLNLFNFWFKIYILNLNELN